MNLVLVLVLVLVLDFLCSVGFTGTMRDRKFGRQFTLSPWDSALDVPKTCGTFAKTDRMPEQKLCWGMLRRRELLLPTWRGCLLILAVLLACGYCAVRGVHAFLSVNDPKPGGALVVEGWAPDYALAAAASEFKRNHYDELYVTGGPIEVGAPLSEYNTYAELATAILLKLGLGTNAVQPVPAPPVVKDRTYTSALALREWFKAHGVSPTTVNVVTEGSHARRSRLMFEKAFGPSVAIGVFNVQSQGYDPRHWWRTSQGVRVELGEAFAYFYARFLFHPSSPAPEKP